MDYRIEWSPNALEDVENIAEFIGRDSPRYAAVVVDKILETARRVERFPKSGRMTPEFGVETIRERSVYSYRLIYRIRGNVLTIAAVIHGKRMLTALDDQRWED